MVQVLRFSQGIGDKTRMRLMPKLIPPESGEQYGTGRAFSGHLQLGRRPLVNGCHAFSFKDLIPASEPPCCLLFAGTAVTTGVESENLAKGGLKRDSLGLLRFQGHLDPSLLGK